MHALLWTFVVLLAARAGAKAFCLGVGVEPRSTPGGIAGAMFIDAGLLVWCVIVLQKAVC